MHSPQRLGALAFLVLCALCACGHAALGSGKGAFRVVRTDHFTLYTDLAKDSAEEEGRRLEQLMFALRETGWESIGDLPLKMNVIMFAHPSDFKRFAKDDILGFALSEVLFEPWIALSAPHFGDAYGVVAHELTHAMSYQSIMRMPSWLSEGLASYFESAFFHVDGSFQIGGVPKGRYQSLRIGWDPPTQLISAENEERDQRFYASSWLLVHYLMTREADAFVRFQDQLARGVSGPDAWRRAFPHLQGDKLDQTVEDYMRAGVYESFIFEFKQREHVFVSSHPISAADEHVLLALLWNHCDQCSKRATEYSRRDLEQALSLEPNNVRALALRASLDDHPLANEVEPLKALVRAEPGEWLAWVTLGMTALKTNRLKELSASPEWDPGAHAVELAPRHPYALALDAWSAALRGEREHALVRIRSAQRLAPTDGRLQVVSAGLLASISACDELRELVAAMAQNAHADFPLRTMNHLRIQADKCSQPTLTSMESEASD